MNDQLSDFLTRIRNAGRARLQKCDALNSQMNRSVAEILVKEGFIKTFKEVTVENKNVLRVYLRFENSDLKKPVISGLKRASRPGLRRYVNKDQIPKVMSGFGISILSTSKGVVSDKEAKKLGVGGELLCTVW